MLMTAKDVNGAELTNKQARVVRSAAKIFDRNMERGRRYTIGDAIVFLSGKMNQTERKIVSNALNSCVTVAGESSI